MKYFFVLFLFGLISCSSAPEEKAPETVAETNEGALDKVMKNKDCGLFDVFYDGCKTIYSDAEKSLYEKKAD